MWSGGIALWSGMPPCSAASPGRVPVDELAVEDRGG